MGIRSPELFLVRCILGSCVAGAGGLLFELSWKGPLVLMEAFELFVRLLGELGNGNAVTVVPVHFDLITQQAADLLNVSRPQAKLRDEEKIPFSAGLVQSVSRLRSLLS